MVWPPQAVAPIETPAPVGPVAPALAPWRRALAILVVTVILATMFLGVALAMIPRWTCHRPYSTRQHAHVVRSAVTFWQADHDGCPRLEDLELGPGARTLDAWGAPFRIDCSEDLPVVRSDGPDGEPGTEDDIQS